MEEPSSIRSWTPLLPFRLPISHTPHATSLAPQHAGGVDLGSAEGLGADG